MSRKRARGKDVPKQTFREFLLEERKSLEDKLTELSNLRKKLTMCSSQDSKSLQNEINLLICEPSLEEFDKTTEPYLQLLQTKKATEDQIIRLYKNEVLRRGFEVETINMETCSICNVDYVQGPESCSLFCPACGRSVTSMESSSNAVPFGDEVEATCFSYKRINHLKEWITHFQAKETTVIPKPVIDQIMGVLRSKGLTCASDILMRDVKRAVKELQLKKYNDMSMNIWITISGRNPIRFDPIFSEKIHLMFRRIQIPFAKHCPSNRKNFLSYPYLMFKFSQLLGYDHLLPYFTLLKGPDKLQLQEDTFEKICKDVGWMFIKIPEKYKPKEEKKKNR
jgi:hypothetical protein